MTIARFLLLSFAFVVLASACAPVPAYRRGILAHPCMRADARPEESRAQAHMLGAREGSQGATGEVGGGCGCR